MAAEAQPMCAPDPWHFFVRSLGGRGGGLLFPVASFCALIPFCVLGAPADDAVSSAHAGQPGSPQALTDEALGLTPFDLEAIAQARTNLDAGIAAIKDHYSREQRVRPTWALLYKLSLENLEILPQIPSHLPSLTHFYYNRSNLLQSICTYWAARDSEKLLQAVRGISDKSLGNELRVIAAPLLAADHFAEATELLDGTRAHGHPEALLREMAANYRGDDMALLAQWLSRQPPGMARAILADKGATLAHDGERAKLESLVAATPPELRENLLRVYGGAHSSDGLEALLTNSEALHLTEHEQVLILAGALTHVPLDATDKVWNRVLTFQDPTVRADALHQMISRLLPRHPSYTVNWVLALPREYHTAALSDLIEAWYQEDPVALLQWIATLPAGPDRALAEKVEADIVTSSNLARAKADARQAQKAESKAGK